MTKNLINLKNLPTKLELERETFRRSYFAFFKYFWDVIEPKGLELQPFIEYLCNEIETVFKWSADFELQKKDTPYDLLVNIAPGMSKSSIISKFGPAYVWTLNPDTQIIASSYSASAVKGFTHKFKRLMNSDEFREIYSDLQLDIDNVTEQTNNHKGLRLATSTNGSITGKHADILMIDDSNKPPKIIRDEQGNPKLEQGATITELISANAWHDDVLVTRKTDKKYSRSIYVQQRLHRQDTSGYILNKAKAGDIDLKHIILPSEKTKSYLPKAITYIDGVIVEEQDLSFLYKDNLLDPDRMTKKILKKQKGMMGSFVYYAQHQQNPSRDKGGLIKPDMFKIIDRNDVPDNLVKNFYSDTSEGKKTSDNMATGCFSLWEGNMVVWEVMAVKKTFPEFIGHRDVNGNYVSKVYDSFVVRHGQNYQSKHFFEGKSTGTPYIQYINAHTPYNAVPDQPIGSKVDRVMLSQGRIEASRILLVRGNWIDAFKEECRAFTGKEGDPDDRVDVLTGMIKVTSFHETQEIRERDNTEEVTF